jgi:hypothetical protein
MKYRDFYGLFSLMFHFYTVVPLLCTASVPVMNAVIQCMSCWKLVGQSAIYGSENKAISPRGAIKLP